MAPPPPEPKYVLRDGMDAVSCVDFGSEDTLFVGTQDGWIHVWDLSINRKKLSFQVGNSVCLAVKVHFKTLITQIKGEAVTIQNLSEKFELQHQFDNSYVGFCKIEVDSTFLYLPGDNAEIKVMNLNNYNMEKCLCCTADKLGEVMAMKAMKYLSCSLLLVGYESGDMYMWDVFKGNRISQYKIDNVPMALDFDVHSGKGVCGTESNKVVIFRIDTDFTFSHEKSILLTNPGVSTAIIRPDRKIMVLGCWDGNLRVYSWKSGRILAVLSEHAETINDLSYSSCVIKMWDSILLAAGSKDKSVSLWSFL